MKKTKKKRSKSEYIGGGIWYYRPFKVITTYTDHRGDKAKNVHWEVREYFPNVCGSACWTADAIEPVAETKEGLIKTLKMMIQDVKHYKEKVIRRRD